MEELFHVKRVGGNSTGSGSRLIWTDEQLEYVLQHYNIHHDVKALSKLCNVSQQIIRGVLRKSGVYILSTPEKAKILRPRRSDYFEVIDSFEKAYWLGFLYADGCNYEKRNSIRINLQKNDASHLQKFLNAIGAINHKICYQNKKMDDKEFITAFVAITDKKMCQDLADKGCIEKKSLTLKFPNERQVPSSLLSHFVRGYFDGDGSIYYTKNQITNRIRFGMSIIGTRHFLEGVQKVLNKASLKLECRGAFYALHIGGINQIYNVLSLLYKDSEEYMELSRKREKFEMLILQRVGGEPVNAGCA